MGQAGHGAAAVYDEEQFGQIAVCHVKPPYGCTVGFLVAAHMTKEVASQATLSKNILTAIETQPLPQSTAKAPCRFAQHGAF